MDDALRKTSIKPRVVDDFRPCRFPFSAVENENKVQIRAITELQPSQLAVSHHGKSRVRALGLTVALYQFGARHRQSLLDHHFSEIGQIVTDSHQRQRVHQFARSDAQHHAILDAAERVHLRLKIVLGDAQKLLPDE